MTEVVEQARPDEVAFTSRIVPWMKLGELVDGVKTLDEAIKLGGMDFTVSARPAAFRNAAGEWVQSEKRVSVVRDDTEEEFEYVSKGYEILQFHEAFAFMDAISPQFVAAGILRGGRQGFIVVKPEAKSVTIAPGGDEVEMFVVLRTSHDRSRAVEVSFMPLRHLCMNQLTLQTFGRGVKHRWSIHHTSSMHAQMDQAHGAMAQLDAYTETFNRLAERLMLIHPTEGQAKALVKKSLFFGGKDEGNRDGIVDTIIELWHNDEKRVGFNDTGWGLVNAASEYFEWHRRGRNDNTESRFLTALNGPTHQSINKIAAGALALAA